MCLSMGSVYQPVCQKLMRTLCVCVCLFVCLSLSPFVCLSVKSVRRRVRESGGHWVPSPRPPMFVRLSVSVCRPSATPLCDAGKISSLPPLHKSWICQSASVCLSVCMSLYLSVSIPVLSVNLSVYLFRSR